MQQQELLRLVRNRIANEDDVGAEIDDARNLLNERLDFGESASLATRQHSTPTIE
jgi:hypothetical protein